MDTQEIVPMKTGGEAIHELLSEVDLSKQLEDLKTEIKSTRSIAKKNDLIKKIKYISSLKNSGVRPEEAYVLHNMPVLPPVSRPIMIKPGNRAESADVNKLYQDHININNKLNPLKEYLEDSALVSERTGLYEGAMAVMGLGEAVTGANKARNVKGLLQQISGDGGPKTGFFQSKILNKKQDFSGRATIYAEPNLGFNEIACPEDMIWSLYKFHIIRDLVKSGYLYPEAKKATEERTSAAMASFSKLIRQIPVIANRAPTLMQSNITAHFPVPIKGKTLGINPIHLPMYAGDFDGDALTIHVPITPEAIEEARSKLLPEHHIYDFRKGLGASLIAPGHEAILGSVHLTEPDHTQQVREFDSEQKVLEALKAGEISVNTPIRLRTS